MKKVFIPELKAHCQLMDSYEDLRKENLLAVVRIAYLQPRNLDAKLDVLQKVFIAPKKVWKQLEDPQNHEQLWRLLQSLDWVYKGPQFRPAQFVRVRGKAFYFPDDKLYNLGTAEFVIATAHLIGFHTAKDDKSSVESLDKFMATIARPKPDVMERIRKGAQDGDIREAFSSAKSELRAAAFAKVDLALKIMVAQWFNNAANNMLTLYGMVGNPDPDAPAITQGMFVQDWERQIVRVAEGAVYGNYDRVMERGLPDVLSYIYLKNEETKRQIEANKRNNK